VKEIMGTFAANLRGWLGHPLVRGLDIDSPETTELRRQIIREKPILEDIYKDWYTRLVSALPPGDDPILEVGSGGGFLREFVPDLITSDVIPLPGIDRVIDARSLPFPDKSLRGIAMVNVLHHVPAPRDFLREATRCVRAGGVLSMIEPWVTPWSTLVYRKLHHEPFDPRAQAWEFPPAGPLSGANGSNPWIMFVRDRARFEQEFPEWQIRVVRPFMPLRYLLSGGVSMRSLVPSWSSSFWRGIEFLIRPWNGWLGLFAHVVVERTQR
jgi:SAM-dependent methyltransferase